MEVAEPLELRQPEPRAEVRFNPLDIRTTTDDQGYLDALGKPKIAEVKLARGEKPPACSMAS